MSKIYFSQIQIFWNILKKYRQLILSAVMTANQRPWFQISRRQLIGIVCFSVWIDLWKRWVSISLKDFYVWLTFWHSRIHIDVLKFALTFSNSHWRSQIHVYLFNFTKIFRTSFEIIRRNLFAFTKLLEHLSELYIFWDIETNWIDFTKIFRTLSGIVFWDFNSNWIHFTKNFITSFGIVILTNRNQLWNDFTKNLERC